MRITQEEKNEIIAMWQSGKYYIREISEWMGISITSIGKIIREFQEQQKENKRKERMYG